MSHLDGEKDGSDLKSWAPLFLQDVEADPAKLVYVWVVDPRDEPDLTIIVMIKQQQSSLFYFWSSHRVIFGQKQLKLEHTSLKWTSLMIIAMMMMMISMILMMCDINLQFATL